jgi:hypothetical protein
MHRDEHAAVEVERGSGHEHMVAPPTPVHIGPMADIHVPRLDRVSIANWVF